MILVDTSVWVGHFQHTNATLVDLLSHQQVATHPFVVGELALGGISTDLLAYLRAMPKLMIASDDEVLTFIDRHALVGQRIGYVDAHLLAAAVLASDARVWTQDKSMAAVAARLGIATNPVN